MNTTLIIPIILASLITAREFFIFDCYRLIFEKVKHLKGPNQYNVLHKQPDLMWTLVFFAKLVGPLVVIFLMLTHQLILKHRIPEWIITTPLLWSFVITTWDGAAQKQIDSLKFGQPQELKDKMQEFLMQNCHTSHNYLAKPFRSWLILTQTNTSYRIKTLLQMLAIISLLCAVALIDYTGVTID